MKLSPNETAVRALGGWAVYDKWNATRPSRFILIKKDERELLARFTADMRATINRKVGIKL